MYQEVMEEMTTEEYIEYLWSIPDWWKHEMDEWREYNESMTPSEHPLLEDRSPSYTHATVRRAFIVWLRCGQRNDFHDVCNYYHQLEALENQLPSTSRDASRNLEYSLYEYPPPTSPYQQLLFPYLYPPTQEDVQSYTDTYLHEHYYRNVDPATNIFTVEAMHAAAAEVTPQDIFQASQLFKNDYSYPPPIYTMAGDCNTADTYTTLYHTEGTEINQDREKKGTSKQAILETSRMIRNYCTQKNVPLKNFLENFKKYSMRCGLKNTIMNVVFYIKRQTIHEELKLAAVMHKAKRYTNANRSRARAKRILKRSKAENKKVKCNDIDPLNYYETLDKMAKCVLEDKADTEEKNEETKKESKEEHTETTKEVKVTNEESIKDKPEVQEEEEEFVDAEVLNTTNGEEDKYVDASTSICETYNEKTDTSFETDDMLIQIDINLKTANTKLEIVSV